MLNQPFTWLAGAGILLMMVHVVAAGLSRTLLQWSALGTIEIVSYGYMVVIVFVGIFLATLRRAHVRVDVVHMLLPKRAARICDSVSATLSAGFLGLFAYALALVAYEKTLTNETVDAIVVHLPIWPMRWVACVGVVLSLCAALWTVFDAAKLSSVGQGEV